MFKHWPSPLPQSLFKNSVILKIHPVCSRTANLPRRNVSITICHKKKTSRVFNNWQSHEPQSFFSRKICQLRKPSRVFKNWQSPPPPFFSSKKRSFSKTIVGVQELTISPASILFFWKYVIKIRKNNPVCSRTDHLPSRNLIFMKICHFKKPSRLFKNWPSHPPQSLFFLKKICHFKKQPSCVFKNWPSPRPQSFFVFKNYVIKKQSRVFKNCPFPKPHCFFTETSVMIKQNTSRVFKNWPSPPLHFFWKSVICC